MGTWSDGQSVCLRHGPPDRISRPACPAPGRRGVVSWPTSARGAGGRKLRPLSCSRHPGARGAGGGCPGRSGAAGIREPEVRGEDAQAAQVQPASGSPRCGGRMLRSLRCSRPPAAEAIAGRCCGRSSRAGASRATAPRGVTAARHPEVAAWQSPGRAGRALSENPEFCQEGRKRKSDEDNDFGERRDRKQLGL